MTKHRSQPTTSPRVRCGTLFVVALTLGATACTGLGVQTGPTLTQQLTGEMSVGDNLWAANEPQVPTDMELRRSTFDTADLWMEADDRSDWNGDAHRYNPRARRVMDLLVVPEVLADQEDSSVW